MIELDLCHARNHSLRMDARIIRAPYGISYLQVAEAKPGPGVPAVAVGLE